MPFQKYIGQNMKDDTFISGWDFVSKLSNISQKMIETEKSHAIEASAAPDASRAQRQNLGHMVLTRRNVRLEEK